MIPIPRIALVGRPNVGKSTLFNRICGRRKAIVDRRPGSTRDRNYAQASWQGAVFELCDTGGLMTAPEGELADAAANQAQRAIEEADLVVFLVDARSGLLPDDEAVATRLRRLGKKVVLVANKVEGAGDAPPEFARLGFEQALAISAEHGAGVGDLLDAALALLPRVPEAEDGEDAVTRVALVGRPNVGKSSLLNRLLGKERSVVSEIPGTTRDAVDSPLEHGGRRYLLVDTAGIRRTRLLKESVDHVSVAQARHAIERSHVAILLMDASEGFREMDATIGGYAHEAGRALVIAANKWDLARDARVKRKEFDADLRDRLKFLAYAQLVAISARTGEGIAGLWRAVDAARAAARTRVATGELNRFVADVTKKLAPKAARGSHDVTILFATQVGVAPPTFVFSLNHPVDLHFSYQRYLENQLRHRFGFEGTPIVIHVRTRRH